jgi:hypothetical protein
MAKKTVEETATEVVLPASLEAEVCTCEVEDSARVIEMIIRDLAAITKAVPDGIKSDQRPLKAIDLMVELIRAGTYSRRFW